MNGEGLAARLIRHVRPRVFRYIVFCRDLAEPFPDPPNPAGVRVGRLDYRDFQAAWDRLDDEECRTYLAAGRDLGWMCYLAWVGDRVAGMTYVSDQAPAFRRKRVLDLAPDERYSGNSHVLPEFRGQKIFHHLKVVSYREQAAAGVRRIYNVVDADNLPSIRTHLNLGCVPRFRFRITAWMLMNFLVSRQPVGRLHVPDRPASVGRGGCRPSD